MAKPRNARPSATASDAIASNADFVSFADLGRGSGGRSTMGGAASYVTGRGGQSSGAGTGGGGYGSSSMRAPATDRDANNRSSAANGSESAANRNRGPRKRESEYPAARNGGSQDGPRDRNRGGDHRNDGGRGPALDDAFNRSSRYPDSPAAPGPSRFQRDLDRHAMDRNAQRHAAQPRNDGRNSRSKPESGAQKRKIRWDEEGDQFDIDEAEYDSRTGRYTEHGRNQARSSAAGRGSNANGSGPTYNGGYNDYAKPPAHASLPNRPDSGRTQRGGRAEEVREPPRKKAKSADKGQSRQGIQMRPSSRNDQYQAPWIDKFDFTGQSSVKNMLNGEVRAAAAWLSPTAEEHAFRQKTFDLVRTVINNYFPEARAFLFGSQVSGLYLPGGDLDIVIDDNMPIPRDITPRWGDKVKHSKHTVQGMSRDEEAEFSNKHAIGNAVLRAVKDKLMKAGVANFIEHVTFARVPVLKFKSALGDIPVDISFSSLNGLETAELIERFLKAWPALRPVVLLVKAWLSSQGFNEVRYGGLSSYAVICMWIRQFQNDSRIKDENEDPNEILFELLLDFFRFYAGDSVFAGGLKYETTVICVREGDEGDDEFPFCGRVRTKQELGWQNAKRDGAIAIMDPCNQDNDISKGSSAIFNIARRMNDVFLSLEGMFKARRREWKEWESSGYRELPQEWTDDRGKLDPRRVSVLSDLTMYTASDIIQRARLRELNRRDTLVLQIDARGGYLTEPDYDPEAVPVATGTNGHIEPAAGSSGQQDTTRRSRDASAEDTFSSRKRRRNSLEGAIMLDDNDVGAIGADDTYESESESSEEEVDRVRGVDVPKQKKRSRRPGRKTKRTAAVSGASPPGDGSGPSMPAETGSGVQVIHQAETGDPSVAPAATKKRTKEEKNELRQKKLQKEDYWRSKGGMSGSPAPSLGSGQPLTPKHNGSGGRGQPIDIPESEDDDVREVIMGEDSEDGHASGRGKGRAERVPPQQDQKEAIENQADFVALF